MAIQIIGYGGIVADVDGTTFRALKITQRPVEYGLLGLYRIAVSTGTFSAATLTAGSVYQFYWSSPLALALVWGLVMDFSGSSSTGALNNAVLTIERQVTAFGSGGTSISVAGGGNNQTLRSSMRPSIVPLVLISTTTALTNGTWTADANGVASVTFATDAANTNENFVVQTRLFGDMEKQTSSPLILSQNEALNLALTTVSGPTFQIGVGIAWSEVGYY